MEAKNYYEILGLADDASQGEIDRLYKRLAFQHHPDRGGDPEYMRAINEAYRVLGNEFTRRAYDSRRLRPAETVIATGPPLAPRSTLLPNTILGRLIGGLTILMGGLFFLFFISIIYLRFMWPLFLFSVLVVFLGVWKVHEVIIFARKSLPHSHVLRRNVWAQELWFWVMVGAGAYLIYMLIRSM